MRFGALLAEHDLSFPTGSEDAGATPSFTLHRLTPEAVSLVRAMPGKRVNAYVLPVDVPTSSALSHVVGTHAATTRYVLPAADAPTAPPAPLRNPLTSERKVVRLGESKARRDAALASILAAITERGDADEAEVLYEAWYAEEFDRLREYALAVAYAPSSDDEAAASGVDKKGKPKKKDAVKTMSKFERQQLREKERLKREARKRASKQDLVRRRLSLDRSLADQAVHSRTCPATSSSRSSRPSSAPTRRRPRHCPSIRPRSCTSSCTARSSSTTWSATASCRSY
jgi:hypothetical protein